MVRPNMVYRCHMQMIVYTGLDITYTNKQMKVHCNVQDRQFLLHMLRIPAVKSARKHHPSNPINISIFLTTVYY
jgi:hypothetical protein